jgi:hypothetical protein
VCLWAASAGLADAVSAPYGRIMERVPDELRGCWQRAWIRFADGRFDDASFVVWLQTESAMADIRIAADRPDLRLRNGFGDCSLAELSALADSESSSGYTTCTRIVRGDDGVRRATAEWFTRGHGVNFQPVSSYPEPGLLSWNDDGTVLWELAPSGAYEEEWRLIPGSRAGTEHVDLGGGRHRYAAGTIRVLVGDRSAVPHRPARLPELIAELGDDRAAAEALLDCEFSFAEQVDDGGFVIAHSTHPWREGLRLDADAQQTER